MIEIDGSRFAGSGSIVRQAVAYAALTAEPIRVRNARARRPQPGLRPQHLRAIEAIRDLVGGSLEGAGVGSQSFVFRPGDLVPSGRYMWDIGTAGSATALVLAVLPLAALRGGGLDLEVRGGLFQDFAPSPFHLEHVLLRVLASMGVRAEIDLVRPGYVPTGGGILRVVLPAAGSPLRPLVLERAGAVQSVWGIALASHLADRQVAPRMAASARSALSGSGLDADIEERDDTSASQPGAALSLFADLECAVRLGADRAGAPRRRAEGIGVRVVRQLLEDIATGATLDRFAADQVLPFAALADGDSVYRVPFVTEHVETGAWLAAQFLGVEVTLEGRRVRVQGSGLGGSR